MTSEYNFIFVSLLSDFYTKPSEIFRYNMKTHLRSLFIPSFINSFTQPKSLLRQVHSPV